MKKQSYKTSLSILAIAVGLLNFSCSRSPEPDTPGQCPIDCGSAVIGNSSFSASVLINPPAITCAGVAAGSTRVLDPVLLMFRVVGDAGGEKGVPRRAISIQPVVLGQMDAAASEKAGNIVKLPDGTYEPTRYIGIATPKEEWCTDSCGVFSVEVTPVCASGVTNTISVTPTSGAMETSAAVFTVTTPAVAAAPLNAADPQKPKK